MANISALRRIGKARRHFRVRKRVTGTPARPRLVVTRSSRHITAQVVDDTAGHTLAYASTLEADLRAAVPVTRLRTRKCRRFLPSRRVVEMSAITSPSSRP